jgi:hypothetical protein
MLPTRRRAPAPPTPRHAPRLPTRRGRRPGGPAGACAPAVPRRRARRRRTVSRRLAARLVCRLTWAPARASLPAVAQTAWGPTHGPRPLPAPCTRGAARPTLDPAHARAHRARWRAAAPAACPAPGARACSSLLRCRLSNRRAQLLYCWPPDGRPPCPCQSSTASGANMARTRSPFAPLSRRRPGARRCCGARPGRPPPPPILQMGAAPSVPHGAPPPPRRCTKTQSLRGPAPPPPPGPTAPPPPLPGRGAASLCDRPKPPSPPRPHRSRSPPPAQPPHPTASLPERTPPNRETASLPPLHLFRHLARACGAQPCLGWRPMPPRLAQCPHPRPAFSRRPFRARPAAAEPHPPRRRPRAARAPSSGARRRRGAAAGACQRIPRSPAAPLAARARPHPLSSDIASCAARSWTRRPSPLTPVRAPPYNTAAAPRPGAAPWSPWPSSRAPLFPGHTPLCLPCGAPRRRHRARLPWAQRRRARRSVTPTRIGLVTCIAPGPPLHTLPHPATRSGRLGRGAARRASRRRRPSARGTTPGRPLPPLSACVQPAGAVRLAVRCAWLRRRALRRSRPSSRPKPHPVLYGPAAPTPLVTVNIRSNHAGVTTSCPGSLRAVLQQGGRVGAAPRCARAGRPPRAGRAGAAARRQRRQPLDPAPAAQLAWRPRGHLARPRVPPATRQLRQAPHNARFAPDSPCALAWRRGRAPRPELDHRAAPQRDKRPE